MGSPAWPCAADTSNSYHPFPVITHSNHHHRQDRHPFFGVAFVSVDQDSGFFEEDVNGVSSNSKACHQQQQQGYRKHHLQQQPRPLTLANPNLHHILANGVTPSNNGITPDYNENYSNYYNSHPDSSDSIKRYSNSGELVQQQTHHPEPSRKKFRANSCVLSLREIPSWNIYYHDQRRHLAKFSGIYTIHAYKTFMHLFIQNYIRPQ
jgi:hypothetical protein